MARHGPVCYGMPRQLRRVRQCLCQPSSAEAAVVRPVLATKAEARYRRTGVQRLSLVCRAVFRQLRYGMVSR
jgi:hypothetical protein